MKTSEHLFGMLGGTRVVRFGEMVRTRQSEGISVDNINNSVEGTCSEHSAANQVEENVDISRQLTEEQARSLAPDNTLVVTMKRLFEDQ